MVSDIANNNSDEVGYHIGNDLDKREENDACRESSSSDVKRAKKMNEEDRLLLCQQNNISELISYATGSSNEEATLEGLKERVDRIPADIVQKKFMANHVLRHYVGYSSECHPHEFPVANIRLEVVQYMLELAPNALHHVDGKFSYPGMNHGAYPLHYACLNADCPESVIQLLLEKNPSAAKFDWGERGYGVILDEPVNM